jgi:hypothetical protein
MRYTHLYVDENGDSRFEDAQLPMNEDTSGPGAAELVSADQRVGTLRFLQLPPGWFQEQRPAHNRRWLTVLSGVLDVEASDGEVRRFGPGSVLLVEDTSGKGHRGRVVGGGPAQIAIAPVADSTSA